MNQWYLIAVDIGGEGDNEKEEEKIRAEYRREFFEYIREFYEFAEEEEE